ncbi:MAG: helix-turn-helix domain-containing protein, partial [Caldilineaceae bacterium]
ETATATRRDHPEPPDGPKALDCAMQRAAQRQRPSSTPRAAKGTATGSGANRRPHRHRGEASRPTEDELATFYARMVNGDGFLPANTISNTLRDAMLARGLVTAERLRVRGVR